MNGWSIVFAVTSMVSGVWGSSVQSVGGLVAPAFSVFFFSWLRPLGQCGESVCWVGDHRPLPNRKSPHPLNSRLILAFFRRRSCVIERAVKTGGEGWRARLDPETGDACRTGRRIRAINATFPWKTSNCWPRLKPGRQCSGCGAPGEIRR